MAELLKILAIVSPAVMITIFGIVCGGRFVDRRLRVQDTSAEASLPISLHIDDEKVKIKQLG
jgi:Flp pilus assembly protein TadG